MNQRTYFYRRLFFVLLFAGLLVAAGFYFLFKPQINIVIPAETPQVVKQTPVKPTSSLAVLFGGDVFMDRAIRRAIEKRGPDYLWASIEEFLKSYPYKIANLEGPIWPQATSSELTSFSFAFQEDHVRKLKELEFTVVSLANNHTLNKGVKGLAETREALDRMQLPYFGDPQNIASSSFKTFTWEGKKIALVGEHDLIADGQDAILGVVKTLSTDGYFVIVYPHWGAEYELVIPDDEQIRGRALIDAGADLIIGAHPHVIQPIEIYKEKVILYSLGNLLFDQYFSFDTMHGLMVGMEMTDSQLRFSLYPTEQDRTYQIHLAEEKTREDILNRIADTSLAPAAIKEMIRSGSFEVEL